MVGALLEAHREEITVPEIGSAAYVLVHAIDGALFAAVQAGDGRLDDPRFAAEIVRLGVRYLTG
jgi:hypothetical protein